MNPIVFALRRPYTVVVGVVALAILGFLATRRMQADIFPDLNTPVIYVAQPYGGMSPQQMEGFITNYFEYHFLYINGIEHVESRNIGGVALMKLFFHPGTNMAQAMAETVSYVNRSRSFMPPNTVPPFIMRFDAGSVPVGYLVCSSETKTIGQIQDEALFKVRPMFAHLPGVSAPPPFGGNQRTIIIRARPGDLNSKNVSPDEIVQAIVKNNKITPAGNLVIDGQAPFVPVGSLVEDYKELANVPVRMEGGVPIYVKDVANVIDGTDVATGYGLVNGKRSVYILVTKRTDASTLSVVAEVKRNLPKMQAAISDDIKVSFEFDQSPYVTRAIWGLSLEAGLGAALTGLMVLLFLRDPRSVIVVILNIPLALLGALTALWLTGQTINLMTLGGLALSVGILVDESTVEVENIHTQMEHSPTLAHAVRQGNLQTAVPRLLAMLCILAVFIPSFFMQGAARALFVPLTLAVGFSMVTSYLLSSTLVPVLCVWLLKPVDPAALGGQTPARLSLFQNAYSAVLGLTLKLRWLMALGYVGLIAALVGWWFIGHPGLGMDIFPAVDSGQFQLRIRTPAGTPLEDTETLAQNVLAEVAKQAGGDDKVDISVSLVGTASYNYPINSIFLWTSGPQEAVLRIALKRNSGIRLDEFTQKLRQELPNMQRTKGPDMKSVSLSFEAGDIVSQVMGFGANTPVEVAVHGPNMPDNIAHAAKIRAELAKIESLRDLAYDQALAYPSLEIEPDREKCARIGVSPEEVGNAIAPWTLSSRFVAPNYWRDPKSGIGYQVQVEVENAGGVTVEQIGQLPVKRVNGQTIRVQDVCRIERGSRPGQVDRYNMRRQVTITANVVGEDLGRVATKLDEAIAVAGDPPRGSLVSVRGQVVPMRQMFGPLAFEPPWKVHPTQWFSGLSGGLIVAVIVVLLLLTGYFQSVRLALAVISTVPAVIAGVALALVATRTTLNIQSFIGAIMAVGVAVANAILLATFAEQARCNGLNATQAALDGATHRLRAILMTSCAMLAGMLPMALGMGDGGEQTAPLGRAVIGGLVVATFATLFLLPSVFAIVMGRSSTQSVSMDPDDPARVPTA